MQISVLSHLASDKKSFYNYLFEEHYLSRRWHIKNAIFQNYPTLQSALKNVTSEQEKREVIDLFVSDLYGKYGTLLNEIVTRLQERFDQEQENIDKAFLATMDIDMRSYIMKIVVSMFPSSMFGAENVTLSVAAEILYGRKIPYVGVFLHEMIHILRNNLMKEACGEDALSPLAREDLKEIVAPVILRDRYFDEISDGRYLRKANQKLDLLNVSMQWEEYSIVDYFEIIYQKERKSGGNFLKIFQARVATFSAIETEILEKHDVYNSLALKVGDNTALLKELERVWYSSPIVIPH